MFALYLFALGLGGVLLAASFFGDADGDDADVTGGPAWQAIFSMRNATYFLFSAGLVGTLLTWIGTASLITAVVSIVTGVGVGAMVGSVFSYLRRTDSSEVAPDSAMIGSSAVVTLSVGKSGLGKVDLIFEGRRVELLAKPFDRERIGDEVFENGAEVLIVDIVAGTALIARAQAELPDGE